MTRTRIVSVTTWDGLDRDGRVSNGSGEIPIVVKGHTGPLDVDESDVRGTFEALAFIGPDVIDGEGPDWYNTDADSRETVAAFTRTVTHIPGIARAFEDADQRDQVWHDCTLQAIRAGAGPSDRDCYTRRTVDLLEHHLEHSYLEHSMFFTEDGDVDDAGAWITNDDPTWQLDNNAPTSVTPLAQRVEYALGYNQPPAVTEALTALDQHCQAFAHDWNTHGPSVSAIDQYANHMSAWADDFRTALFANITEGNADHIRACADQVTDLFTRERDWWHTHLSTHPTAYQ